MDFKEALKEIELAYDKANYLLECQPNIYKNKGLSKVYRKRCDVCRAIIFGVAKIEKKLTENEPVVRAHWIPLKDLDLCECSRCGRKEIHYYGCEGSAKPEETYPYCHCGAHMVAEE